MEKIKAGIKRAWSEWLRSIVLMILIITAFRSAVADWNDVPTGSMKPTILEGDRIFVNKLAYDLRLPYTRWRVASWDDPARGDIVVLYSPADQVRLVKRVVGLPGDTIAMEDNCLVVNGRSVKYDAIDHELLGTAAQPPPSCRVESEAIGRGHAVMISPGHAAKRSFDAVELAADDYFVLGDNRDQSMDSRYFGPVPRSAIIGRATAVAASVDPEHRYTPRWSRFFTALR